MFRHIVWFEIRFWLRSWTLWAFLIVIGGLICGAMSSSEVLAELDLGNVYRNAPFNIQFSYTSMAVFTLLTTAIFVNAAALRDFTHLAHPIVFSTPLRRRDFLMGRFTGAALTATIPMVGVSLGILLAQHLPGADAEQWEAVHWTAHWRGLLIFALPDTLITAALLFAVAVTWRREMAAFIAVVVLFTGRTLTGMLLRDEHWEGLRALADPLGGRAFEAVTRYWTVAEKNSMAAGLSGPILWNRVLWAAVGCAAFAFAWSRFSFADRPAETIPPEQEEPTLVAAATTPLPAARITDSPWARLRGAFQVHFRGLASHPAFVVIVLIACVICIFALSVAATQFQENESYRIYPVTYGVIELVRGVLWPFLVVLILYFSGVLVWKDRDERMDEIADAAPAPEWAACAARLGALLAAVMLIELAGLAMGVAVQAAHGYHRFQFGLYLYEGLVRDGSGLAFLSVLAFFVHVMAPNKYAGYMAFVAFNIVNYYLWEALDVTTHLVQFAGRPRVVYSDFFGDAPYRQAWNWFTLYWLLFCLLLAIATVMFWPRGKPDRWKLRLRNARLRFGRGWKSCAAASLLAFFGCGGWIWYNTKVLNAAPGPGEEERIRADYEKTCKPLDRLPQPRLRSVRYAIDVFPFDRNVSIAGDETIYNPYPQPLDEIHFSLDPHYVTSIDVPGATLAKDDRRLSCRIYRFTPPLQPGEERAVHFTVKSRNRGFENDVSTPQLAENGTFLSNIGQIIGGPHYLAPVIGYNPGNELDDWAQRRKYGLPEMDLMPAPERNCTEDCRDPYVARHSDWVDISAVISTTPDQIAVAPGSLVREWRQNGRRYFEYRLDHASMNLYCFASARYEVAREEWNGIRLEVYYLKEHPWNVRRMLDSMKKSLDYYIRNFGPYAHKEARIVEFPRVAAFAAAFAGTMPYSEAFGFIANVEDPGEFDPVFYVVAHEMAHQWWDEQVVGANMEGATLLSETLAQYSALMVMEKEYGRDRMRRFLRYEMDQYLSARGHERMKERPLARVEPKQFYIFYKKGSVAFYYLKEMIGEEAVNRALRKLIRRYAYAPAPYPTSYDLLDALREETPPGLRYLLRDLFEDITLFSNRTLAATATRRADGKYDVTLQVEARKFKADSQGRESEIPVDDWIDIGAFARPAAGGKYGDTLYRERVHITQRHATFTFTVAGPPDTAGIDPFALLIDRVPGDNVKGVTVE